MYGIEIINEYLVETIADQITEQNKVSETLDAFSVDFIGIFPLIRFIVL